MKVTSHYIEQLEKDKRPSRCTRWRLWASTEAGRKSKRFRGTHSQAQDALKAWVSELEAQVPNSETFGAYAESWRRWREKSGNLSPNMVVKDARNVRALARTELDGMRMDEITPDKCRDALLWLKQNPVHGEGELSNSTIASFHVTLTGIFGTALADGRIARNPLDGVKYPKVKRAEREALSPEEMQLLLNRLDELPLDGRVMAVYLIACLGLRRAEACALLDSDVSGGYANVHLAVKESSGTVAEPKSRAGVRKLPMPPRLAAKVDLWRAERARIGIFGGTLACNTEGGLLLPQNLYRWWAGDATHRGVRDGLGCAGMVLHELRHSNLSMMARHMSPFDLQRYAGWSSIEPAKIYVHDDLESVARGVADAWSGLSGGEVAPVFAPDGMDVEKQVP